MGDSTCSSQQSAPACHRLYTSPLHFASIKGKRVPKSKITAVGSKIQKCSAAPC